MWSARMHGPTHYVCEVVFGPYAFKPLRSAILRHAAKVHEHPLCTANSIRTQHCVRPLAFQPLCSALEVNGPSHSFLDVFDQASMAPQRVQPLCSTLEVNDLHTRPLVHTTLCSTKPLWLGQVNDPNRVNGLPSLCTPFCVRRITHKP